MERSRLTNILLVLLIVIAILALAQMLAQWLSGYADLLLLFLLGWFVSFVLNPLVFQLTHQPIPRAVKPALSAAFGATRANQLVGFRFSRPAAVVIVYLGLLLAILLAVAWLVPPTVVQLSQLALQLPEYIKGIPKASAWLQNELAQFGIYVNIPQAAQTGLASLQTYAAMLIQNALNILTSLLSFFANLFLVLIISFFIALDAPRLQSVILRDLVPKQFYDEYRFFSQSVDRTFGGFIRGQLVQAALVAIGTAVAMTVFGLDFVLVASLFAGVLMLIPLVGPILALIPPLFVVLLQSPHMALWLTLVLFVYQFIIVNVLMPRLLSEAVGLHPLLVLAALLVSIKVAGFWGAFFGIPVVGVLWAMGVFFFERWQRAHPPGASGDGEEMD